MSRITWLKITTGKITTNTNHIKNETTRRNSNLPSMFCSSYLNLTEDIDFNNLNIAQILSASSFTLSYCLTLD